MNQLLMSGCHAPVSFRRYRLPTHMARSNAARRPSCTDQLTLKHHSLHNSQACENPVAELHSLLAAAGGSLESEFREIETKPEITGIKVYSNNNSNN